jgi:hypothetical protein
MPSKMDHIADAETGGLELARLAACYELPAFVKKANQEYTLTVPSGAGLGIYADPTTKQFPCHTKASTWLSHLFYQEKKAEFHVKNRRRIEDRLEKFAAQWGISPDCAAIVAQWKELHKNAEEQLPDSAFAYVWASDDGRKERRYPLRSAMEVKVAAEWLAQYRDRMPFSDRNVIAQKILTKAASFGADIHDQVEFLERQAGRGVGSLIKIASMIRDRALLVPATYGCELDELGQHVGGLRESFRKMAETVENSPRQMMTPATMIKLAETIEKLDRQLGLSEKYSAGLPRAEDVIFEATFQKTAAELTTHVPTTSGTIYNSDDFSKLAVDELASLFGPEFVSRVCGPLGDIDTTKMAEEVRALPRPDAQMLDGLLSENGISPVMRKAASAKYGFDESVMRAIADTYK